MDRQKRKILRISIPEKEYEQLRILAEQGMRNAYLLAIAPTSKLFCDT